MATFTAVRNAIAGCTGAHDTAPDPASSAISSVYWAGGGMIGMGTTPRGDSLGPSFVTTNTSYMSSAAWDSMNPWFLIYPGANNTATNVRIKISGFEVSILLKSTGKWVRINTEYTSSWCNNQDWVLAGGGLGAATATLESDGNNSYKPLIDVVLAPHGYPLHGGLANYAIPGADVASVFIRMTTELIIDNVGSADDRANSEFMCQVGYDFMPFYGASTSDLTPMTYNPLGGQSKLTLLDKTGAKVEHYIAPVPCSNFIEFRSKYRIAGARTWQTIDEFFANPPPYLYKLYNATVPNIKQDYQQIGSPNHSTQLRGEYRHIISDGVATRQLLARESGALCLFDTAAAITYTLPPPKIGMQFEFYWTVACTSGFHYVAVNNTQNESITGLVLYFKLSSAAPIGVAANGITHIKLRANGTTGGGMVGSTVKFTAINDQVWLVTGRSAATAYSSPPFVQT